MFLTTPVYIPFETNRIMQFTSPSGNVYVYCTLHANSEPKEKGQPFRKLIGIACPEDPGKMLPTEAYAELFPEEDGPRAMDVFIPKTEAEKQQNRLKRKEGLPYWCNDEALFSEQHVYQDKMMEYNRTLATEVGKRQALLKEMFAEIGEDCIVETPVNANWGCRNVHLGSGVYINSNVTFVDDTDICIGDNCLIAANVTFTTAGHPILPELREADYQYELPIHIGRNVWIGNGAQILPGVSVGDNTVIGAGSIVTRDIPAGVVAYGVPCKVQREIGDKDREFYCLGRRFPKD